MPWPAWWRPRPPACVTPNRASPSNSASRPTGWIRESASPRSSRCSRPLVPTTARTPSSTSPAPATAARWPCRPVCPSSCGGRRGTGGHHRPARRRSGRAQSRWAAARGARPTLGPNTPAQYRRERGDSAPLVHRRSRAPVPTPPAAGPVPGSHRSRLRPRRPSARLGHRRCAVRRWNLTDPESPRALAELTGPSAQVDSLAFTPGSHLLAASDADGRVRLWDTTDPDRTAPVSTMTGSPPPTTKPHGIPHRVSFRADGTVLAAPGDGHSDGVRLWGLADPRHPKLLAKLNNTLQDCTDQLISTAFSPVGDLLATPCGTEVYLWDTTDPAHTVQVNELTEPDTYQSGAVPALFAPSRAPVLLLHATTTGVHVWDVTNAPRLGAASSLGTSPSGFDLTAQFSGGSYGCSSSTAPTMPPCGTCPDRLPTASWPICPAAGTPPRARPRSVPTAASWPTPKGRAVPPSSGCATPLIRKRCSRPSPVSPTVSEPSRTARTATSWPSRTPETPPIRPHRRRFTCSM
ncbi:hypothetical protein ACFQ51_02020 [Streptomyces kaempferi]